MIEFGFSASYMIARDWMHTHEALIHLFLVLSYEGRNDTSVKKIDSNFSV